MPEKPLKPESVRKRLLELARRRRSVLQQYATDIEAVDKAVEAVRSRCPHPNPRYHSDPAGGSGGYWSCDTCGADLGGGSRPAKVGVA